MENVTDVAFRVQIQSEIEECSVINAPFIEFPALWLQKASEFTIAVESC